MRGKKTADKFTTEKTTFDMKEMKSRHAYDMLMQNLNAQIAQGEKDRLEAEDKEEALQAKADTEGELRNHHHPRRRSDAWDELASTCEHRIPSPLSPPTPVLLTPGVPSSLRPTPAPTPMPPALVPPAQTLTPTLTPTPTLPPPYPGGAILGSGLVYIFPALMFLKHKRDANEPQTLATRAETGLNIGVALSGVMLAVVGGTMTLKKAGII